MANDPSMPPSEMNSPMPTNASPDMASPAAEASAPAGGDVTISMPRAAFTAIHTLATQLAQGLDQLEQSVAQQESQSSGAPSPAGPAGAPAAGPGEPDADEAFLKSLAEEGSKR